MPDKNEDNLLMDAVFRWAWNCGTNYPGNLNNQSHCFKLPQPTLGKFLSRIRDLIIRIQAPGGHGHFLYAF